LFKENSMSMITSMVTKEIYKKIKNIESE